MMTPEEHYTNGAALLKFIEDNKDAPAFGVAEAGVLTAAAQAHALLGLLKKKLDG